MQALSRGWQDVGKPLANVAVKLYFAQRLDLAIALGCQAVLPAPAGLGLAASRIIRLLVAARAARGSAALSEVTLRRQGVRQVWCPCPSILLH